MCWRLESVYQKNYFYFYFFIYVLLPFFFSDIRPPPIAYNTVNVHRLFKMEQWLMVRCGGLCLSSAVVTYQSRYLTWKPASKDEKSWPYTALSPGLFLLSLNVRVFWHIWISPSSCRLTIQSQNNLRDHSWAPLGSARCSADADDLGRKKAKSTFSNDEIQLLWLFVSVPLCR